LALVTPARERPFLLGDMAEEYAWMIERGGSPRDARRWYWAQLRGSFIPGLKRLKPPVPRGSGFMQGPSMNNLRHDVRVGLRSLGRRPGFTAIALLTLAVGIGANVAMYTVVRGVLLKPLSYDEPDRVVHLFERRAQDPALTNVSYPDFHDIAERSQTLEAVAATQGWIPTTIMDDEPLRINGVAVSGNYFDVLGVTPALGRFFLPEEDEIGHAPVVVVSHAFWTNHLAADPAAVGRTLELSSTRYTIIGVTPPSLEVPRGGIEVWQSRPTDFQVSEQNRTGHNMRPVARLAEGVSLVEANAELERLSEQLQAENPEHVGHRVVAVSMMELMVGDVRTALMVLFAAVGLVLMIACANIANLLLSRATGRQREVAVRTALGAQRSRLVYQFLTESLLLATGGAILGVALATVATRVLGSLAASGLPRTQLITIDASVLAFAAASAVITALVFGLVPALQGSVVRLAETLKEGSRGSSDGLSKRRWRRGLVVGELALAVMLLTGGGLLLRTFANLRAVDVGFESDQVTTARLYPPRVTYPEHEDLTRYYRAVVDRLSAIPGVASAAAVSFLPMSGGYEGDGVRRDDRPPPEPGEGQGAEARAVTPEYFRTMGIDLIRGRGFTAADDSTAPLVLIINQALADALFPGEDPLGKRVSIHRVSREIVGIVANVRQFGVQEPIEAGMYAPHAQPFIWWIRRRMSVAVKAEAAIAGLGPVMRQAVRDVDPTVTMRQLESLTALQDRDIAAPRFQAQLLILFAGIALFLAAVGVAAVMGYNVAQRRGEIGVRLALGAERSDVMLLVLAEGMKLVLAGLAIGLVGSAAASRLIRTMLFGVSPSDMQTYLIAPAVLAVVALVAVMIPAFMASRVDPIEALREE
jgi:putative ABC transport system permease protein